MAAKYDVVIICRHMFSEEETEAIVQYLYSGWGHLVLDSDDTEEREEEFKTLIDNLKIMAERLEIENVFEYSRVKLFSGLPSSGKSPITVGIDALVKSILHNVADSMIKDISEIIDKYSKNSNSRSLVCVYSDRPDYLNSAPYGALADSISEFLGRSTKRDIDVALMNLEDPEEVKRRMDKQGTKVKYYVQRGNDLYQVKQMLHEDGVKSGIIWSSDRYPDIDDII